mgnify:CR=1 FL=1
MCRICKWAAVTAQSSAHIGAFGRDVFLCRYDARLHRGLVRLSCEREAAHGAELRAALADAATGHEHAQTENL